MEPEGGGLFSIIGDAAAALGAIMAPVGSAPDPSGPVVMTLQMAEIRRDYAVADIADVVVETGLSGATVFALFDEPGRLWLSINSEAAIGGPLIVSICGDAVSEGVVPGQLDDGSLRVLRMTDADAAEDLAAILRGDAPCPVPPTK